eukprot:11599706-Ditylum_brightwellii.AAC.1
MSATKEEQMKEKNIKKDKPKVSFFLCLRVCYQVKFGFVQSCIAGHFYLVSTANPLNYNGTLHNDPVHTECNVLKHVVCLAAEVEYA